MVNPFDDAYNFVMSIKRRNFIGMSGLGFLTSLNSAFSNSTEIDGDKDGEELVQPPVVMAPREDGVEIVWMVPGLKKGYVEFGLTPQLGSVASATPWGLRPANEEVIKVRLDGLEPGKVYYYRTVTESFSRKNPSVNRSEVRTFKTLSSSQAKTRFSVWNDTHERQETIEKLNQVTPKSDFLLWNGDISNDWKRAEHVAPTVLYPGNVDFTKEHPLVVVRGNHDMRGAYAYKFEQVAATDNGLPWCAFRSGPVAFLCLDTGEDKADDNPALHGRVACEPMRKEQAKWMRKVLQHPQMKQAPYRVVCCHIPLRGQDEEVKRSYDYFSKRSRDLWHSELVKWGAQLVISGHVHKAHHLPATKAFPYHQLVGGGPRVEQATLITGDADEQSMVVRVSDLSGRELHKLTLRPIS